MTSSFRGRWVFIANSRIVFAAALGQSMQTAALSKVVRVGIWNTIFWKPVVPGSKPEDGASTRVGIKPTVLVLTFIKSFTSPVGYMGSKICQSNPQTPRFLSRGNSKGKSLSDLGFARIQSQN